MPWQGLECSLPLSVFMYSAHPLLPVMNPRPTIMDGCETIHNQFHPLMLLCKATCWTSDGAFIRQIQYCAVSHAGALLAQWLPPVVDTAHGTRSSHPFDYFYSQDLCQFPWNAVTLGKSEAFQPCGWASLITCAVLMAFVSRQFCAVGCASFCTFMRSCSSAEHHIDSAPWLWSIADMYYVAHEETLELVFGE